MKKFISTIILLLFVSHILNAQWVVKNEGIRIQTIDFVNENIGWLGGDGGSFFKTEDGGENWNLISIDENWDIKIIDFIDESVGWLIGNSEELTLIAKSIDGGRNWVIQKLPDSELGSIYAVDENNAFVVGDRTILKTTNRGTNWIDISPNLPGRKYNSLWFQDSLTGVVVGSINDGSAVRAIILKTSNGGKNWDETIVNEFNEITDLQFLDTANIYFRAFLDDANYICNSGDMLLSWSIKTQPLYTITSYQFLDHNIVYAIIADNNSPNNIMKSINGGIDWQTLATQTHRGESLNKIYITLAGNGYVLGNLGEDNSILLKSADNKANWILQKFSYPITTACFINKEKWLLFGGYSKTGHPFGAISRFGHILSSNDGGTTWNIIYGTSNLFKSYEFINESNIILLANASIYKTTNCGVDWQRISTSIGGYEIIESDLCFVDEENGYIVGYYSQDSGNEGAAILNTFNGGETWSLERAFTGGNLFSICAVNNTCWSVGESGMIVKYTAQDGWVLRPEVTDLPLKKVFFYSEDSGWITGGYLNDNYFQHIILRTTNGGENWTKDQTTPYLINDIFFIDSLLGWAVGNDEDKKGVILKSTNGGEDWEVKVENLLVPLNSIAVKENYAWAVGEGGLVLRTTDNGVNGVNDRNNKVYLTEFNLEQNYPNPFNPSTTIKYSIPYQSKVILKIYDVLGNEIETIVNEEKLAGTYELEFNSHSGLSPWGEVRNLASGIYFYQLKAGSFIETKKMLLLK